MVQFVGSRDSRSELVGHGDFVYASDDVPIFVSSDAADLICSEGGRFLDAEASNGAAAFGYDPTLLHSGIERMGSLPLLPSFLESEARLRLAVRITDLFQQELGVAGRVAFSNGGAQAIELALKIARASSSGERVAVFEGAYHGRSPYTSKLGGSLRYESAGPLTQTSVARLPYPGCEMCRFGQVRGNCEHECVKYLHQALDVDMLGLKASGREGVGAFLFEPILNVGGMVAPDKEYLRACVTRFRNAGAIIVADEVFTGLYRTGRFLGCQHYDIVPDIVVLSKALTNGIVPFGCVWARNELLGPEAFKPRTHSVTFGNNVLGVCVADAVLDKFGSWCSRAKDLAWLEGRLTELANRAGAKRSIVRETFVQGVVLRITLSQPVAFALRKLLMRTPSSRGHAGMLVASTGAADDVISLHPRLNSTDDEISAAAEMLMNALAELEKLGTQQKIGVAR